MNEMNNYAKQWLELAEGDLESAKHLLTLYPHKLEVICYLCEQSAEKMLKGLLVIKGKEVPKTHDLMKLCRMCTELEKDINELFEACSRLMPFGVQVRYPNNTELYEKDMIIALKDAETIMELIEPKMVTFLKRMEQKDECE